MISRRAALQAGLLGAGCMAAPPAATGGAAQIRPPDLGFLRDSPLMNAERARYFMQREGIEALVVAHPANVFYVTNHWPQLDRMGYTHSMFGIFCRDPGAPLALIAHAFGYYYSHSDETAFPNRIVFTYTQPDSATDGQADADDPAAVPPTMLRIVDESQVTPRERRRRESLGRSRGNSATAAIALAKALRELRLEKASLGVDDVAIEPM
ncbi:MAG: hypothetical protein ACRETX_03480, partial [Steroidobacteraceae bacterium]